MEWDISRNALNIDVNIRTIEFPQYMLFFLKANYCLKIHNAYFKLASPISG